MMLFTFLLVFSIGIFGLYIGVVGFREYTNITRTAERISLLQIIKIATLFGGAGSLIFAATISSLSFFDPNYVWNLRNFWSTIFVSLVPGIIITLGTIYQIYTTALFRDMLIRKYRAKDNLDDHND